MESKKPDFLDDPDAPPTEEEQLLAARLRDALSAPDRGGAGGEAADLAHAIAIAYSPSALPEAEHRAIVTRAIEVGEARRNGARVVALSGWRRNRAAVTLGVAAALSLAAGAALILGRSPEPPSSAMTAMTLSRSTQPLFDEPFARTGGQSARIDRIASARAADLRENRFARWGVQ